MRYLRRQLKKGGNMSETKAGAIRQSRAEEEFKKWWKLEGVKANKFLMSWEAEKLCRVAWLNGAYAEKNKSEARV